MCCQRCELIMVHNLSCSIICHILCKEVNVLRSLCESPSFLLAVMFTFLKVVECGGQRRTQRADAAQSGLVGVARPGIDAGGAKAARRASLHSSRGPSLCVCSQHRLSTFHAGDSRA